MKRSLFFLYIPRIENVLCTFEMQTAKTKDLIGIIVRQGRNSAFEVGGTVARQRQVQLK